VGDIDAASIFPYPPDDPHVIAGVRSSFKGFAKHLSTTHGQVVSDGSVIGGKGWSGDGAAACGTEITGNAALIAAAEHAMGQVDPAIAPYATAIDTARGNIDTLRKNYIADWNAHERALTTIDNSSKTTSQKSADRSTENQSWRWTDYGAMVVYQGYLSDVDKAAKGTRKTLEAIGSNVNGKKISPKSSDFDLRQAVLTGLPLLHMQQAQKDAQTCADLAKRAAAGDPKAVAELAKYGQEASDPYFATALMNDLTAKGLVEIPGAMAKYMYDKHGIVDPQTIKNNAKVLNFLSTALATATNDTNQPHVDQAWLNDLKQEGRAQHKLPNGAHYDGYWGLGQIMEAADKKPPYGTSYLRDVGRDLVSWVRDQDKNGPTYPRTNADATFTGPDGQGPFSNSIDNPGQLIDENNPGMANPLYGLLHAAATNGQGAQQILDYTPPGQKDSDLTYLLHTHRGEWNDHGNELGNALEAATIGHDKESMKLASQAIHILGTDAAQYAHSDGSHVSFDDYSDDLSGMRDSVANILGSHINEMNFAISNKRGDPSAGNEVVDGMAMFGAKDLSFVLLDTERDDGAYKTLLTDQAGYMRKDLDAGAGSSGTYDEKIQQLRTRAGADSYVLGYLLQGRDEALVGEGKATDEQSGAMADMVKDGLGLIPVPGGKLAELGYDKFGSWLTDKMRTHAEIDAYGTADTYKLQNQTLVNQMVESTLVQHGVWPTDHQPPLVPPKGSTVSAADWFVDQHTHKIIPLDKMTEAQLVAFKQWAATSGSVPDVEQQAGGTNNDGGTDYKKWLGLDT